MAQFGQSTFNLNLKVKDVQGKVKQAVREGLEEALEKMEDVAKNLVPVATGDLQASIDHEVNDMPDGSIVGTLFTGAGDQGRHYGAFVEEGAGGRLPQPFMRPSLDAVRPEEIIAAKVRAAS